MSFQSIRARLGLAFASLVLCLVAIAAISWASNRRVGEALGGATAAWSRIDTVDGLRNRILRLQLLAAEYRRSETAATRNALMETLAQIEEQVATMEVATVAEALRPLQSVLEELAEAISQRRGSAVLVRDTGGAVLASFGAIQSSAMRSNELELADIAGGLADAAQGVMFSVTRFQATDNAADILSAGPFMERLSSGLATLTERVQSNRRLARQASGATQALPGMVDALSRFRTASEARQAAEGRLAAVAEAMNAALEAARGVAVDEARQGREGVETALALSGSTALAVTLGAILLALGVLALMGRTIATPMRRLAEATRAIAGGDTGIAVPHRERRDEVGAIAEALEVLRGAAGQAFAQGQMLEQLPTAVMNTAPGEALRITYVNAAAQALLGRVSAHLSVAPDALVGQPAAVLGDEVARHGAVLADPAALPCAFTVLIGEEVLELRASAILDGNGAHSGTMLSWIVATEKVRLADTFEREVGAVVEAVATRAESLQVSARSLSAAAELSGAEAATVADAGGSAHADVQSVAAAAEQMAGSVQEIARQVAEAASVAGEAVAEVHATDTTVSGLSEAAHRIDDVVRLIGNIASQTNLLALNATIEAARAGDAGKGFAVVASEVKNLAGQTGKATEEIAAHIQQMQAATAQAVSAIQRIGATVERTNTIATTIAAAVEEQGAATHEIARSASQVARSTETVAGRIVGIRSAAEATGAAAAAMLDDSGALAQQAAALREKSGGFLRAVRVT